LKYKELTLPVVTQVLKDLFGYGSFIGMSFIRRVLAVEDKTKCPTLSIDPHGTLRYNPEFFTEHVNTERKLQEVLFHEMLHPVLGDMHRRNSFIANLASDMVINTIVAKTLGHADLFKEIYKPSIPDDEDGIGGLLRPESAIKGDGKKFAKIYHELWSWWGQGVTTIYDPHIGGMRMKTEGFHSIEEIREAMEVLLSHYQGPTVLLIGSHGHTVNDTGGRNDPMVPTIPIDAHGNFEDVAGEVKERLADAVVEVLSKQAGYGDDLMDMAIKTIKANVTLVRQLLEDFTAAAEFNSFKSYMKTVKSRRLIFPKRLSRRDAVMVGAGVVPVFWQSPRTFVDPKEEGMNVFLDVSGSEWNSLPMTLGFLRATKGFTEGVYQFSNKIAPTSLSELFKCKGKAKIDTTGGTDYDCIVEYCCEHNLRKVVIITDGWAGLSDENKKRCLSQVSHAVVIYTDNHNQDEFWKKHYHKSYSIHDLFKACK
jgi:hypothetical protein